MSARLLDEMRRTMRRRHYSIRTERSYCSWVKRYILFHKMRSRHDLENGEKKIETFLTHLAMDLQAAASRQDPPFQNSLILNIALEPNEIKCAHLWYREKHV